MQGIHRPIGIAILALSLSPTTTAVAEPIGVPSPHPANADGQVFVTYSFSNLFDGSFLLLDSWQLRAATLEALGVWATYAPIHFVETPDSGPPPSDRSYQAEAHAIIRIGHHPGPDLAHAFLPGTPDGRAGDIHFDASIPWTLGANQWNFLEAVTHEVGHALGLEHEVEEVAIMNPFFPQARFGTLDTAFLLPSDIEVLRSVYGTGVGSVRALDPVPEPATLLLTGAGIAGLIGRRLRCSGAHLHGV